MPASRRSSRRWSKPYSTLCVNCGQAKRRAAHRMVAMVSIGAMRVAMEAWRHEGGKQSRKIFARELRPHSNQRSELTLGGSNRSNRVQGGKPIFSRRRGERISYPTPISRRSERNPPMGVIQRHHKILEERIPIRKSQGSLSMPIPLPKNITVGSFTKIVPTLTLRTVPSRGFRGGARHFV